MSFSQLTLLGQPVSDQVFDHAQPASKKAFNQFPPCLLQYAHSDTWATLSLQEITQEIGSDPTKHIFVTDSILKSHNPNQIFNQVRRVINNDQYFTFRIVTAENIKRSLVDNLPALFFIAYYPFHFLFRRVLPKLKGFRKLCRVAGVPVDVSKAEILGRLMYTGFDLVDVVEKEQETIVIARRNPGNNPSLTRPASSEGLLFRMKRVGQHEKPINVYKLRSMHPYAEYVQAYLHSTQGLTQGGKFKNDFRVSTGGKLIRKYWIDEVPMLYNLLKGDIKLVGVRPISEHYLSLYPDEARAIRINHKPGLLPPFYADLPKTFDEIVRSEVTYLQAYEKAPLRTDWTYLKRIATNILVNKARSQ